MGRVDRCDERGNVSPAHLPCAVHSYFQRSVLTLSSRFLHPVLCSVYRVVAGLPISIPFQNYSPGRVKWALEVVTIRVVLVTIVF